MPRPLKARPPPPRRVVMVRGWPRDAVARGLAFRARVKAGLRQGEFASEAEGIRKLRKQVWGD
jgi:hypothetical protein